MGIILSKVRIKNYRSIQDIDIGLGLSNLLIGQNNSGKTNFLKALNLAILGTADISESDIFVSLGEKLERTKAAMIDIMFQPVNDSGRICGEFSEFWMSVFTEQWITPNGDGVFVGIRTEIKYDATKDSYALNRRCIRRWGESIDDAMLENKRTSFNEDMRTYLQAFYMDANRDIVQDLRNRRSYFGRITSDFNLTQETIDEIENQLNEVNARIIESIPSLRQTKERIAVIGQAIGSGDSTVEIEPLARRITDLSKGMDIVMQDGNAATFPVAQHGYGTRSWISFLSLSAFVENQNQKLEKDEKAEQYVLLTMEEPEAHLHPQAQRQLFEQISNFQGQKIVSTHSPSIIAQSSLTDAIHFSKRDGITTALHYKANDIHTDEERIFREVINTRADLLFASIVILCEGITEEMALPVYFIKYFGRSPYSFGVSIINIGGKDKYTPFLSLLSNFKIPWFIFSDGEPDAIKAVNSSIKQVFGVEDYSEFKNVIIIENGDDYEKHLIHSGYSDVIIETICKYHENEDFFKDYVSLMHGQRRKKNIVRNYKHADGITEALIDVCHEHKTDYAIPVAARITELEEKEKRFPPVIKKLLLALSDEVRTLETKLMEDT